MVCPILALPCYSEAIKNGMLRYRKHPAVIHRKLPRYESIVSSIMIVSVAAPVPPLTNACCSEASSRNLNFRRALVFWGWVDLVVCCCFCCILKN